MNESPGEKIRKTIDAVFQEKHDYVPTRLDAYPELDRGFYEEATRAFQARGFTHLGDLEDTTITKANPARRTCVRVFVGEGGRVTGAIYHFRLRGLERLFQWIGLIPRRLKVIDLETEFHNGVFIGTTNAPTGHELTNGPRVLMRYLKRWDFARLLKAHNDRVTEYLLANNARAVLLGSMESVIASQQRMNFLKAAHRRSLGGVSREELRALGGAHVGDEIIDEVYRQVRDTPPPMN